MDDTPTPIEPFLKAKPLDEESDEGEDEGLVDIDNEVLATFRGNSADTRLAVGAQLNISGLLLTLVLGSIYLLLTDSRRIPIHASKGIISTLILISIGLVLSIGFGLAAIYVKSTPLPPITRMVLSGYMSKCASNERFFAITSTFILLVSIAGVLYALSCFQAEFNNDNVVSNSTPKAIEEPGAWPIVIMPYPLEGIRVSNDSNATSGFYGVNSISQIPLCRKAIS